MLRATGCLVLLLLLGGCLQTPPPHPKAVANNAICTQYMQQDNLDKAQTYCDLALEYSPMFGDALVNRGLIEQKRGNMTLAKEWYIKALRSNNEQAQGYNNLGVIYQQEQQYGRAHDNFQRALKVDPDYTAARYNLAVTLVKMHRLEQARSELKTLIAVNPTLADPQYLLGEIAYEEGKREEAIGYLTRAVELSPQYPEAQELLGDVLMDAGKFAEAQDAYNQCIQVDTENAECRKKLPLAARRAALTNTALRQTEQSRSQDGSASSLYELSRTFADKGLKDKQEDTLIKCIKMDSTYAPCHFSLYQFYNEEDRVAEAVIACRNYIKFANTQENAREVNLCEKFLNASQ